MTSAVFSMTAGKRAVFTALAIASIAALPSVARADGPAATGPADALFREGRTLLDAKRYDEACPKLAEAQKQEPGAGTLLALALCHEGQGKTATAWGELNEAAVMGKGVGRNDLAAAAQKRANVMEPLLSRLVVHMPRNEDVDYEVKCDGAPVEPAKLGTPVPVDPGEHRVDVSAKGRVARSYTVRLSGAGVVEIVIDKLEEAARAPVAAAKSASPIRFVATEQTPPIVENPGGTQRVIGLAIVGLGVVGLGTGAYFGGRALSESAEGRNACPKTPCPANANDANDRAKSSFAVSVTSISAGTGAIALGTIIYMMAPSASTRGAAPGARMTARLVPDLSPTQASLGVAGAF